ncbi:hypothetical protein INR49_009299 [Caranx melampygus]|nr:hypothetical protein INR49_009299 [Caranx melampygus]
MRTEPPLTSPLSAPSRRTHATSPTLFTAACTSTLLRPVPVSPGPTGSTSHRQDAGATPAADGDGDDDDDDDGDGDGCLSLSGPLMSRVRGRSRCRGRIFVLVYLKRSCGSGRSGRSGRSGGQDLRYDAGGEGEEQAEASGQGGVGGELQ